MSLQLDIRYRGQGDFTLELNCEIPATGVTAIYGPSGSGKSTVLDCIAGLRQADSGSIRFNGENWSGPQSATAPWDRHIGYVFQDSRLFPHLTVRGNLDYAAKRASSEQPLPQEELIKILGLGSLLEQTPETLSAGQKQRVAI